MLEQLFGSKTRVSLLRLFLNNPDKFFYVRELSRNLEIHLNSIRRELDNLEKIGIISSHTKIDFEKELEKEIRDNKKYYKLNNNFVFVEELRSLLIKARLIMEKSLVSKVESIGKIHFFLLSGIFVGRQGASVDMLIVGNVNKSKFQKLIKLFEKELGQSINYAILKKEDFNYRMNVTDKFLYDLLERKNMIIIDNFNLNHKL